MSKTFRKYNPDTEQSKIAEQQSRQQSKRVKLSKQQQGRIEKLALREGA